MDLSHNHYEGTLQLSTSNVPSLNQLYLYDNRLEGSIPPSICELSLVDIVLRNNQFSGEFPRAWSLWKHVNVVDVSHNKLSGTIPSSMGIPSSIRTLKMNNNNFSGEIPFSLQNCSDLMDIDLGGNKLTGKLPSWNGSKLYNLQILQLDSNHLSGHIPLELCNLQNLQILDLGNNNFSGTIPKCVSNLTSLVHAGEYTSLSTNYYVQTTIISKGRELEYSMTREGKILNYVTSVDLSSNSLEGEIPRELCSLIAMASLNLSRNQLTGNIPSDIGKLTKLESLDLSHNYLSGYIPQSMSSLNFLSYLNLSYNKFIGKIPMGHQLQTLDDASIYEGNPSLCGFPLNNCTGDEVPTKRILPAEDNEDHEEDNIKLGIIISTVLGFIIGFWVVCGTLVLKKSWRDAYFQFCENIKDKVALAIALKITRLQRR